MKAWILFASCISLSCCPAFGQRPETPADEVDVYIDFDSALWDVLGPGETLVSDTFSKVGVNITWHTGSPPKNYRSGAGRTVFSIRWADRVPATSNVSALAVARPYSPVASITLYEESLRRFLNHYRGTENIVFGYVVAHELAHLMQGLNRHSDSGILKAQWSYKDVYQMASGSLDFTAYDVQLIHDGLNARMSRSQTLALKAAEVQEVQVGQNRQ
jgi:hypothetical protein